jgi:hypothetical protein
VTASNSAQERKPTSPARRGLAIAALLFALLGLLLSLLSTVLFVVAWQTSFDGWGLPGAALLAAGLLSALLALIIGPAARPPWRGWRPQGAAARWSVSLAAVTLLATVAAALFATWALGLARPAGAELAASGHDRPAHSAEARSVLTAARLETSWLIERENDARLSGLAPVCRPLPEATSKRSVFAATRDEGGSYLAASYRDGVLVRTDLWSGEGWLELIGSGWFSPKVPEAERLVLADLGEAEAIRYVDGGYGVWVVARFGDRERGALAFYQGYREPSWPREGRVYSGEAILRYLTESEALSRRQSDTDAR